MGYESAPAVELVATRCCVCGRPLLDALSVKSGIGPICAAKTGYGREDMPEDVRAEVNRLVYELAALGCDARAVDRSHRLRELGFDELAARVEERLQSLVDISTFLDTDGESSRVIVEFPKLERDAFNAVLVDLRAIPGRRYDETRKRNTFPKTRESNAGWRRLLAKHFPGRVVQGLKGLYVVWPDEGER